MNKKKIMNDCPLSQLSSTDMCIYLENGVPCDPKCKQSIKRIISDNLRWQCVMTVRAMRMAEEIRGGYKCPRCGCYISKDTYERDLSLCRECEMVMRF